MGKVNFTDKNIDKKIVSNVVVNGKSDTNEQIIGKSEYSSIQM